MLRRTKLYILVFFGAFLVLPENIFSQALFCNDSKRITALNFPLRFRKYHRLIKNQRNDKTIKEILDLCDSNKCVNKELCFHNRFLFTDFLIYFKLSNKYIQSGESEDDFYRQVAILRDTYYNSWLELLDKDLKTNYYEWANHSLQGESFQKFRSRGSEKFRWLEFLINLYRKVQLRSSRAREHTDSILSVRTPFSSIMTHDAFVLANDSATAAAVNCFMKNTSKTEEPKKLFSSILDCTNRDSASALKMLGVLASQRLYLIRDLGEWARQNMSDSAFNKFFNTIKESSKIYFFMETEAFKHGSEILFPDNIKLQYHSYKAYHFWSAAYLGFKLAQLGHERQIALKEATRAAKQYKRFIRIPGLLYNLALGNKLNAGTVGDAREIMHIQNIGASWGYQLGR